MMTAIAALWYVPSLYNKRGRMQRHITHAPTRCERYAHALVPIYLLSVAQFNQNAITFFIRVKLYNSHGNPPVLLH